MSASRLDADSSEDEFVGGRSHVLDDSSDSSVGRPEDMDVRDYSGDEAGAKKKPTIALNADSSEDDMSDTRKERCRNTNWLYRKSLLLRIFDKIFDVDFGERKQKLSLLLISF